MAVPNIGAIRHIIYHFDMFYNFVLQKLLSVHVMGSKQVRSCPVIEDSE